MAQIVNLRTARKRQKRRQAEQKAAANRLAHGISKAARTRMQADSDKVDRKLDQHRLETGDGQ